jgi:hypothetical protein
MVNYHGVPSTGAQPLQQYAGQQVTQYGAQDGAVLSSPAKRVKRHRRLNVGAIVLCIFVPWMLFCVLYGVMSFSLHYKDKALCYFIVLLGLVFAIVLWKVALDSVKNHDPSNDPTWSIFLAAACSLAWVLGVVLGDLNFFHNSEPFYDCINLNTYPSVDPSKMPGQRVMDAGQMMFIDGSKLDYEKTMAFHNMDTYCVAPIVNGKEKAAPASYDFWAVGMNCCAGDRDFACGEYNNPQVRSGLRLIHEDQSEFYRLAVRQAESAFTIKAKHPLFFHWMQDPAAELAAFADEGLKYFLLGVFTFFAFLFFLVLLVVIVL